jgi:hypothetical protein
MEIWKDVIGYEGIYQVSNLGRIKRISKNHLCNLRYQGEYYLKPLDNGKGYLRMKLSNNGSSKRVMLHRIIAEAFINNPENKKVINHINGNKKDNRIENLEWCTQSYNCLHSVKMGTWGALKNNINKKFVSMEI